MAGDDLSRPRVPATASPSKGCASSRSSSPRRELRPPQAITPRSDAPDARRRAVPLSPSSARGSTGRARSRRPRRRSARACATWTGSGIGCCSFSMTATSKPRITDESGSSGGLYSAAATGCSHGSIKVATARRHPHDRRHVHRARHQPARVPAQGRSRHRARMAQAELRGLLPDRILVAHPELYVGDPDALPIPRAIRTPNR
jgi:hypothetical protein